MDSIEKKIKNIILNNIEDCNEYRLFIFGSRASTQSRKYSDYDIGIEGKKAIPFAVLAKIKTALDDSDLPYKVDVVDFFTVSNNFRNQALKNIKEL